MTVAISAKDHSVVSSYQDGNPDDETWGKRRARRERAVLVLVFQGPRLEPRQPLPLMRVRKPPPRQPQHELPRPPDHTDRSPSKRHGGVLMQSWREELRAIA